MARFRRVILIINLAGFLLLVLAFFGISFRGKSPRKEVLCLVDDSPTLSAEAREKENELLRKFRNEARKAHVKFRTVRFSIPVVHAPDLSPADSAATTPVEYEPAALLDDAAERLLYAPLPEILLLTENHQSDTAVEVARKNRIPISVIPLPRVTSPDSSVSELKVPYKVHAEEPFRVVIRLRSNHSTEGELILAQNGAPVTVKKIALEPGETEVARELKIDTPQRTEWCVTFNTAADAVAENNRLSAVTEVTEKPRLLFATLDPSEIASFTQRLEHYGHSVLRISPDRLPEDANTLNDFSVLFLSDIPLSDLNEPKIAAIENYVRGGGGLFLTGGLRAFALGNYNNSSLEAILPVRSDYGPDKEKTDTAVFFVVDRSGSMKGEKFEYAKAAIHAALENLSGQDHTAVILFDRQPETVVPPQYAIDTERIQEQIATLSSGGGTDVGRAVSYTFDLLRETEAGRKHIVLFSDGISPDFDVPKLTESMRREKITLTAVELGESLSDEKLKRLAEGTGGIFHLCAEAADLPRLFSEEIERVRLPAIEESEKIPEKKVFDQSTNALPNPIPPLRGYVRTMPKEEALVLLAMPDGRPLLSTWRLGLGSVTVWTSDITGRWSADWLSDSGTGRFWSELIRVCEEAPSRLCAPTFGPPPEKELRLDEEGDLRRLAEVTGGIFDPDAEHFFSRASTTSMRVPARRLFTLGAFLLFLAGEFLAVLFSKSESEEKIS
ncbi:MAG: VWA domain-containing protein [Thermoguttaceae bacterium]|jgi:Ca-activated chloride channel family protein